jgi:FkbM family methyltransferase
MQHPPITLSEKIEGRINMTRCLWKDFNALSKLVKNPYDIVSYRLGLRKKLDIKTIEGNTIKVTSQNEFANAFRKLILFDKNRLNLYKYELGKDKVVINGTNGDVAFTYQNDDDLNGIFGQIGYFSSTEFDRLDVKDRITVDIGAFIGDTTILFALQGAKHVYSFEPFPYCYGKLKDNIKANRLEDRITPINAGLDEMDHIVRIDNEYQNGSDDDIKASNTGVEVPLMSLDSLVKKYNIENAVLKTNCEGGEYSILKAKKETVRKFERMYIVYHYGYKHLVKFLKECGFEIVYLKKPTFNRDDVAEDKSMYIGNIQAKRIN